MVRRAEAALRRTAAGPVTWLKPGKPHSETKYAPRIRRATPCQRLRSRYPPRRAEQDRHSRKRHWTRRNHRPPPKRPRTGMKPSLPAALAAFGTKAKAKLANPGATGEPEDQLRAPFEQLLADLAELCRFPKTAVAAVGESSVSDLKTRPDYAVTVHKALVGFIELKAPGKGADPRKFKDPHDKAQWEKLHSLPNLLYTDGNSFSLWQDGELVDSVITLIGDIESVGAKLQAPPGLLSLFEKFLRWEPISPRTAKDLARVSARLCRLLRDEVTEQMAAGSEALTSLAADWRKLLFPEATDERFADGYAQAVTFGLLMARAKDPQCRSLEPHQGASSFQNELQTLPTKAVCSTRKN